MQDLTKLLTAGETARRLSISTRTLANARWAGSGIPYVKVGRAVRYRATDVESFIAANTRTSTKVAGDA